ncbi:MAG: hypothetical protein DMG31_16220 [Acidobacteria bacterium]|nr:MAG: hypothetical protein DMG31_16220 [Acidobacteriota bacterium]
MIKLCGKDVKAEGRLVRIARLDGDKYNFPEDPQALVNGLRKCGTRIDLFTFLPRLSKTSPEYHYPMEWDNLAVLSVSSFDGWWTNQIDNKTRNMVRKAQKNGVVTRELAFGDTLVRGIWEINNECPIRQGKRFPHYGMSLDRVREYAGTFLDRTIYIGAFLGNEMIGFVKLVMDETQTQACLVHILSMVQHKGKAPTNALLAQALRSCTDRGISYLVYENFSYGKKQGDSLSRFKEANGFRRLDLPRYYVPLTRIGWAAFHMGLHHKLVEYLPDSITAKLRDFRTAWYSRKFQLAKET